MSRERIAAFIVLGPLVAIALAVAWYGRAALPGYGEREAVVFNLTGVASNGVWTLEEVNGLNYWWKRFAPATLYVEEGDEIIVNLRSADLVHQFYIPEFSVGPVQVEPGHLRTVRFTASRAGVFQYYCTSMCGTCHFYMRGWLVVTAPGEKPIVPKAIGCIACLPDAGPRPTNGDLVDLGSYLYRQKGCITCHGPEGRGLVANRNSTSETVPDHESTAQKLFLASEEDAQALIEAVHLVPDLARLQELDDSPEISRFPVVRKRFENAKEIIRKGRYTAKLDPEGPEPPLQMPAWQFLLEEREIDALLVYFVSLYPWEEV